MAPGKIQLINTIVEQLRDLKPKRHPQWSDPDWGKVQRYFGHLAFRGDQIEQMFKTHRLEVLPLLRKVAGELNDAHPYSHQKHNPFNNNEYGVHNLLTPNDADAWTTDVKHNIAVVLSDVYENYDRVDPEEEKARKRKKKIKKASNRVITLREKAVAKFQATKKSAGVTK